MRTTDSIVELGRRKPPTTPEPFVSRKGTDAEKRIKARAAAAALRVKGRRMPGAPTDASGKRPADPWSRLIMGKSWSPTMKPHTSEYKRAYKQAYWKYTSLVVSLPFLVVTSWILFDRLYHGKTQRALDTGIDGKKKIFER